LEGVGEMADGEFLASAAWGAALEAVGGEHPGAFFEIGGADGLNGIGEAGGAGAGGQRGQADGEMEEIPEPKREALHASVSVVEDAELGNPRSWSAAKFFQSCTRTMNQEGNALSQRDRAHLSWNWA